MSDNSTPSTSVSGAVTLAVGLFEQLRDRLIAGEWQPGDRLPGEHQLGAEYGVSRATVRTALSQLESLGLTITRRGAGTYATATATGVRADLRRLESLSVTVEACGHEAGMVYHTKKVRPGTKEEADRLALDDGELVLATERSVTADDEVVAFSYDAIPRRVLPAKFDPETIEGSLFRMLGSHGHFPATAVSEIHASRDPSIGWGRRPAEVLYVALHQVHYLAAGMPIAYSRTYFHEGRFQFSLVRTS